VSMVLAESIARRIRVEAEKRGASPEEYILDLLVREMDPGEGAVEYLEAARSLVRQAWRELEKGDLRQAGEKVWGACALAIKAHALARGGRRIESHRDLWLYKDEVARELGEWVRTAFLKADSMHRNFYEGLATKEDVEDSLREVEKLVSAISERVEGQHRETAT